MKLISVILGMLIVAALAYFFAPYFMQKRANERIEDIAPATKPETGTPARVGTGAAIVTLKQGSFEGITVHQAQGTAKLLQSGSEHYIRFEDDFDITNGPDLLVYLGKNGEYDPNAVLGDLKGNSGGQNFLVPATINPDDYDEVWVWCRRFSVGFGRAVLK